MVIGPVIDGLLFVLLKQWQKIQKGVVGTQSSRFLKQSCLIEIGGKGRYPVVENAACGGDKHGPHMVGTQFFRGELHETSEPLQIGLRSFFRECTLVLVNQPAIFSKEYIVDILFSE